MIRVTLSGPKGTGKDELAEAFRRRGFAIVALADPVKVIARDVWGCDPADLWGPSERRETAVEGVWAWSCARCFAWRSCVNGLSPSPTSTPFSVVRSAMRTSTLFPSRSGASGYASRAAAAARAHVLAEIADIIREHYPTPPSLENA